MPHGCVGCQLLPSFLFLLQEYKLLFEGAGSNPGDKTLEDRFFEHEVSSWELPIPMELFNSMTKREALAPQPAVASGREKEGQQPEGPFLLCCSSSWDPFLRLPSGVVRMMSIRRWQRRNTKPSFAVFCSFSLHAIRFAEGFWTKNLWFGLVALRTFMPLLKLQLKRGESSIPSYKSRRSIESFAASAQGAPLVRSRAVVSCALKCSCLTSAGG